MVNDPKRRELPGIVSRILDSLDAADSPDHVGFPMIPSQDSLVRLLDAYLTILMPGNLSLTSDTFPWTSSGDSRSLLLKRTTGRIPASLVITR